MFTRYIAPRHPDVAYFLAAVRFRTPIGFEIRAKSNTLLGMSDTIYVHNLELVGHHGVYDEERRDGRRFAIDVAVNVPSTRDAGASDDLADTVDYTRIAQIVVEVGEGRSRMLVETLAETMCERIFEACPPVTSITLRIRKFATGVPGNPEWVGVEIRRSRP